MMQKYRGKLFCFSPPVMLATFLIEFGFAFYTIWRYKMTTIVRLAVITLLALGTFQLSEYMICGGLGLRHIEWARIGYASISLLPALGIHLIVSIAGKKRPLMVGTAYATCTAFVGYYLLIVQSASSQVCYANYAVFNMQPGSGWPFAVYYYGWLLIGLFLAKYWRSRVPKRAKALLFMGVGYASFILPTTFFNLIAPETISGIPSIMCGFAVLLAFTIVLKVLPNSAEEKSVASFRKQTEKVS